VVCFSGLANNRLHQALVSFVIQVLMIDNIEYARRRRRSDGSSPPPSESCPGFK
jgi:hypothetical protein